MTTSPISAAYVWDSLTDQLPAIPGPLTPNVLDPQEAIQTAGQMQGTAKERLVEVAGRACYDSFGRGRNSADYHTHILEVGHLSVLEHAAFTVELSTQDDHKGVAGMLYALLNRPSLWVNRTTSALKPRITLNLRHVLDWDRVRGPGVSDEMRLGCMLRQIAHRFAPQIVNPLTGPYTDDPVVASLVAPKTDEEVWVSMFLTGSRGFSHELVRHGDFTAISQRSTRYVDESESQWVHHPLTLKYQTSEPSAHRAPNGEATELTLDQRINDVVGSARRVYQSTVSSLEPWLISRGVDKFTARKQARGAARGYLGNALYTEVVFSASIAQWKHMIRQRACAAADAEIRDVFCQAFDVLVGRFPDRFFGWEPRPSPDGIGQVVTPPRW